MHSWKRLSIAGILLLLTCAVSVLVFFHGRDSGGIRTVGRIAADQQEPYQKIPASDGPGMAAAKRHDPVIDIVKEEYKETISDIRTQISLIEELTAYFSKQYPDDWQNRITAFLHDAFPGRADEILDRLYKLQAYNTWLGDNSLEILGMPREERNRILWEKRREIFGSDAEDIWSSDLNNDRIQDAIDLISTSRNIALEEKLDFYLDAIEETYGDDADRFLGRRGYEVMSAFLEVGTVQEDLYAMEPEERRQNIQDIRRAMGLDDDAIKRLEDLDMVRDKRWETGARYMKDRQDIVLKHTGPEQEQMIDELRQEYFGSKADTIKAEEGSGFFRFTRKRIYGRN